MLAARASPSYCFSMKYTSLIIKVVFSLLLSIPALAAPIPGTTSSEVVKPQLGIYRSPLGFEISSQQTDWLPTNVPDASKFIETLYRSPNKVYDTRGTLTVRVDKLKNPVSLKQYMSRWSKEYPRFGYNVQRNKPFKLGKNLGYVVDLVNQEKKRQIRQVVYKKNDTAVILTCRDHVLNFKESLKACNRIIRSFAWNK